MYYLAKLKKQGFKAIIAFAERAEHMFIAENHRFGGLWQKRSGFGRSPKLRTADRFHAAVKKNVEFLGNFSLYPAFVQFGK